MRSLTYPFIHKKWFILFLVAQVILQLLLPNKVIFTDLLYSIACTHGIYRTYELWLASECSGRWATKKSMWFKKGPFFMSSFIKRPAWEVWRTLLYIKSGSYFVLLPKCPSKMTQSRTRLIKCTSITCCFTVLPFKGYKSEQQKEITGINTNVWF